jgi:Iap family predicted aminopeptidase
MDREIVGDLYFSRIGRAFVEELVDRFGSRFHGSPEENAAAEFIQERFRALGADSVRRESFTAPGWTRGETRLTVLEPRERSVKCIALPYCPPGDVEGLLVDVGPGDPKTYDEKRDAMKGAVVMANTASPKGPHRIHRTEKLGRAVDAGAIAFIWMRASGGGLEESGSARFGYSCEVPAVAVSYEAGYGLQRLANRGPVRLRISSTNKNHPVTSYNVVADVKGERATDEIIVLGAHYDGHDIGQGAMDNGAGLAALMEVARVLQPYKGAFKRTLRLCAFAGEEMGLHGSRHYVERHKADPMRFMLNLDGSARSTTSTMFVPAWPEALELFRGLFEGGVDNEPTVWLHSDHYAFTACGVPGAILMSDQPAGASEAAARGYGHTAMDTLDKVSGTAIELEASRAARLALRLLIMDQIPLRRKTPEEMGAVLTGLGLDQTLRYEGRPIPGDGKPLA